MAQPRRKAVCTYCGRFGPVTTDHVPPKSLFALPRPKLVTVKACPKCHAGTNLDDEYFRAVLSLRDGADSTDARAGRTTFLKALAHPKASGFRKSFMAGVREVMVRSPAGLYLGKGRAYAVDLERLEKVLSRVTRGLYAHHFAEKLPCDAEVTVLSEEGLRPEMDGIETLIEILEPLRHAAEHVIGAPETFRYRISAAPENKFCTAWLFTIYDKSSFLALTLPREAVETATN